MRVLFGLEHVPCVIPSIGTRDSYVLSSTMLF